MPYDPEKHDRRSIRLPDHDYGQPGAYFITLCTHGRTYLFGDVVDGRMRLNAFGRIVAEEWHRTERIRDNVALDAFVVMPNHVHGVVVITGDADDSDGTGGSNSNRRRDTARRAPTGAIRRFGKPRPGSLPTIVGALKSAATRRINRWRGTPGEPVWQRNYYEHIVRGRRALQRIRQYIRQNPARWRRDRNHPERT
jgi:REP element-mobilizing transposase RayT